MNAAPYVKKNIKINFMFFLRWLIIIIIVKKKNNNNNDRAYIAQFQTHDHCPLQKYMLARLLNSSGVLDPQWHATISCLALLLLHHLHVEQCPAILSLVYL